MSCTVTARNIIKSHAPLWDNRTERKNRLPLTAENIQKLLQAKIVYLYFRTENVSHECVIYRCDNDYIVRDSYINYRPETSKLHLGFQFQHGMESLDAEVFAKLLDLPLTEWSGPILGWFSIVDY